MASLKRSQKQPEHSDPDQPHHAPAFERRFLRIGVEGMEAQRAHCSRCGRTPLVGERVRIFAPEGRRRPVCDLCVAELPESALGEQVGALRVGASERRLNVVRAA